MTGDSDTSLRADALLPVPVQDAGARLREARNAAGLSIDAVALQLKLAPRQVRALEDNDYARLPGRTFVRGFMRNYARLLRLDADELLAILPVAGEASSLERPSLAPSPRAMGELPADVHAKPSSARWAIPVAFVAVIAIAASYELTRPGSELAKALRLETAGTPPAPTPGALPAPPVAAPSESTATTALRNPVAVAGNPPEAITAPAAGTAAPTVEVAGAATVARSDALLVLVFRGTSWIEVKDGNGNVLLSTLGYPGATHAVGGGPPYDVVLGNAEAVQVTYRGEPFDSAPFVKQNVAKFVLK